MNLVNPYRFVSAAFASTWKTDNISTGSSTSTQIKLPLVSTGTYNFTVDWGDSSTSTITVWNQAAVTHTYSSVGTYTVKITGTCIGWQFNNTGDRLKILSVLSWGSLKLGNLGGYFYGCANLNLTGVSDILDLTGTTSLFSCFRGCTNLTTIGRMNEWNTSVVDNMSNMFVLCIVFNQPIGSWNTINVINMSGMFSAAASFNQNIVSWNTIAVTDMSNMFNAATAFNQPLNLWNTSSVTNMTGMFQSTSSFNQDIGVWNVSSVTTTFQMFYRATAFNNGGSNSINSWNTINVVDMSGMFRGFSTGTPVPFNQNIGGWNVSKVATFLNMFEFNKAFNNGGSPDINNWVLKTTGTINMQTMFAHNNAFNQPLGNWNTIVVTNMVSTFLNAALFNQNIGGWNVTNVGDFTGMFEGALSFNNGGSSTINNWLIKTTGTVNMTNMFNGGTGGLNVMVFNQPLGNWNMIAVTNTSGMFGRLGGGGGNNYFNQDISGWNVSNVTNMSYMFGLTGTVNLTDFNQNIGSWDISKVTNFTGFMNGKTPSSFSTANLDAIYNGWSSRPVLASKNIHFGTAKYTSGSSAGRAILTGSPNNWTITDGGI